MRRPVRDQELSGPVRYGLSFPLLSSFVTLATPRCISCERQASVTPPEEYGAKRLKRALPAWSPKSAHCSLLRYKVDRSQEKDAEMVLRDRRLPRNDMPPVQLFFGGVTEETIQ